jgi:hypothetical protein
MKDNKYEEPDLVFSAEYQVAKSCLGRGDEPLTVIEMLCRKIESQKEVIRAYFEQTNGNSRKTN